MTAWPVVALGDIFGIARGGSPRPIDKFITDEPDGINWVMIGDATGSSKYITKTKKKIKPSGVSRSRLVKSGDFLLTNSMSFGRPYIMRTSGCIHDGWLVLSPHNGKVDPDYFYHLLSSDAVYSEFTRRAAGATVKNLNIDLVKGVEIPLPPLHEQKRIAAILDQADALRRLRQRALDHLNNFGQSIFREMFGSEDIQGIAQPLEELVEEFRYGTSNKATDTGYPTLRIPNVIGGGLELSDLKTVPVTPAELARLALESGDVLFVRTNGNPDYVGRNAVFEPEMVAELGFDQTKWIYASYLIRARLKLGKLHPVFLQYFLTTPRGRRALRERSKTSAGQFNINTKGLGSLSIPVPKIDKQHNFADKIINIGNEIGRYRSSVKSLDGLFASLQQRAFRGEL